MLDLILLLIACFGIFLFFLPFVEIGIDVICDLFGQSKHKSNYQSHENQLVKDSIEDSAEEETDGDGLMLFDDPLFPSEFDND